jgi:DNA-directed RNA polymerase specialized sigma24 family protein
MYQTPHSLLERLRLQPDAVSWKRLVDLYSPFIQSWLRQQRVPSADVDDQVQEVLAVVVREIPAFQHNDQQGAFRRWLGTIAHTRLRGYWRIRGDVAVRSRTRSATGLHCKARLDTTPYATGQKVSKEERRAVRLKRRPVLPRWNYTNFPRR